MFLTITRRFSGLILVGFGFQHTPRLAREVGKNRGNVWKKASITNEICAVKLPGG
jgi:hypothetical protein